MRERAETGRWPRRRSAVLDWLVNETVGEPYADNLLGEFCRRLIADGVPLARATMHIRTLNPQFYAARLLWRPDLEHAEITLVEHGITEDPRFLRSPVRALYEGAEGLRQRLDIDPPRQGYAFPIYDELRRDGFTDYVALPMTFTSRQRHATSWASARPGGFDTEHILRIGELLPVLAMAVEIRVNRRVTRNLLDTYVGRHAGERILAGEIRRGMGDTVGAAIWNCDIRGFTQISELWPRDDVIRWLNEYFDVMVEPVERHGGEILKFIGDGLLALFPLDDPSACSRALAAALEARREMRALNRRRREDGVVELGYGIALHVGDVMYGNIGSRSRLDFTVIGPAVNVAARMQGLCKQLGHEILVSGPFTAGCARARDFLVPLGRFPLRGVGEPVEVLAARDEE